MKNKIFIVDDHPMMRRGFSFLINQQPDMVVSGEASDGLSAIDRISEDPPALVIVDLSLNGMGGLDLIKYLRIHFPEVSILVVSAHDEMLYGERAIRAGARGYVMKSVAGTRVLEAMRCLLRGGFYISESVNTKLLQQYQTSSHLPDPETSSSFEKLSDRELEVFELLGCGFSAQQIADRLSISQKTVYTYRARIMEKLGIEKPTELLREATLWYENRM